MKTLLIFLAGLFCVSAAAQGDLGGRTFSAPPAAGMGTAPSGSAINAPMIFDAPKSSGSIQADELNTRFGKQSGLMKPGAVFEEKLNKTESEVDTAIRKNQYLGDYKTKSGTIRIMYRDHEAPDGDLIRVLVNDMVVKESIVMEGGLEGFDLTLAPGFNKIDFEALNQGLSGPNTAEFQVFDDTGNIISVNRWNLATGFKATIIVVKE